MRFILHKVVALQTTPNFQVNRRYVVNYRQPEQPVQVVDGVVTSVTDSTVWFEKLPIPTDSILNVCFLLSLPSEILRLAVSFLDPATQCAIAPTSSLIRNSVNEQQSSPNNIISPEQRRLNARNFIQPLATAIEHSILRDRQNSIHHAIRYVESHLNTVEPTIRPFVFQLLRTDVMTRDIMSSFIQRQNDPVIKYVQNIADHVSMDAKQSDGCAVKTMEYLLGRIEPSLLNHVRDGLRHSVDTTIQRIEHKLSQREQSPAIELIQNIEAHVSLVFTNKESALRTMESYLKQADPAIRDAVRQGLKEQGYKTRCIESLLTEKETALATQNSTSSFQTNSTYLGG